MSGPPAQGATAKRRFRGKSLDERRSLRREQLIQAGLDTFGTRGFHKTGVRDICAAAGLTERYFYESFENREALFLAVYDHAVSLVRRAVDRAHAAAGGDLETLTRDGLAAYLTLVRDDPRLARVLLIDVLSVGVDVGRQSLLVTQTFASMIARVIERAYPNGLDADLDVFLVASGLVGSTVHLVMLWAAGGFREPLEVILEHAALFYSALREHLPAP